jgi:integrase
MTTSPALLESTVVSLVTPDITSRAKEVFDSLDLSEATRTDYKYRIGEFLSFLQARPFDRDSLLYFKRELAGHTDISVSTKNKYFATAKIFLKELNRKGIIQTDITQNIKAFSQDKKHKRDGLSEIDIAKVSEAVRNLPITPYNARLKAIVSILTLQGLRQIEITRLDVSDIDLVSKKALVQGKGRDDKELIDLHPVTVSAIKDYLKTNKIADGALFTSLSNNKNKQRLSTRGVRLIVKDFLNQLQIEKSTHGFRHYFTTTLIKNYKGNLLEVAAYTRHKSLEMLQVYNDAVKKEADLPRYYQAFNSVSF